MWQAVLLFSLASLLQSAEITAGTPLTVRMRDAVDSRSHQAGQTFRAHLDEAVLGAGGGIVIPRGSEVTVRLEEVSDAGRFKGRPLLALVLVSVLHEGRQLELSSYRAETSGGSRLKRTSAVVGGAAAAGALLGGGIGAAAGAGAGSAYMVVRRGRALTIPSESRLTFTLAHQIDL